MNEAFQPRPSHSVALPSAVRACSLSGEIGRWLVRAASPFGHAQAQLVPGRVAAAHHAAAQGRGPLLTYQASNDLTAALAKVAQQLEDTCVIEHALVSWGPGFQSSALPDLSTAVFIMLLQTSTSCSEASLRRCLFAIHADREYVAAVYCRQVPNMRWPLLAAGLP